MPRIRTIKPEFCTSEQIAECSTSARLLFVELWMFCDDAGRHPASIKRLKMECFPGDPFTNSEMEAMVDELINAGLLIEYEYESAVFWQVSGWKHQKIDRPNYKYPPLNSSTECRTLDESSAIIRRSFVEPSPPDRSLPESTGVESTGREGKGSSFCRLENDDEHSPIDPREVVELWNQQAEGNPIAAVRSLSKSRRQQLTSRLKDPKWPWREAIAKLPIPNDRKFNWQPDFDWLIKNDRNARKLAEGSYDRQSGSRALIEQGRTAAEDFANG